MNQTQRPPLSLEVEFEIEGRERQLHIEYWPHLQQMQELTEKARADYRLLLELRYSCRRYLQISHALRRILASYAVRLFEMQAKYFPSGPDSRHW